MSLSARADAQMTRMLRGPILPTLWAMALPNLVVLVVQSALGVVETHFVGVLGTEALAGVALVFPAFMLMTMMSAGAVGGGISAALSRALGQGRGEEARRLVWHAWVLSLAAGLGFGALGAFGGPWVYGLMGGEGAVLQAAEEYGLCLSAFMPALWLFNGVASTLRGTGDMGLPSVVTVGGTALALPLSPWLIGQFGVAGAGLAIGGYFTLGTLVLLAVILSGRAGVRPLIERPRWIWFRPIFRIGGIGALNTVQTNLTTAIVTGLFAGLGPAGIAAYGIAARLEYLVIPLGFSFGAPLVALVGANIGAGQPQRARRAAWTGAALVFVLAEAVGLAAALAPRVWIGLFDQSPEVLELGARLLRITGPAYGLLGLTIALNLAAQGAQRIIPPFVAGSLRLGLVGGLGLMLGQGVGIAPLALLVALGMGVAAIVNMASVARPNWTERPA